MYNINISNTVRCYQCCQYNMTWNSQKPSTPSPNWWDMGYFCEFWEIINHAIMATCFCIHISLEIVGVSGRHHISNWSIKQFEFLWCDANCFLDILGPIFRALSPKHSTLSWYLQLWLSEAISGQVSPASLGLVTHMISCLGGLSHLCFYCGMWLILCCFGIGWHCPSRSNVT